MLLLDEKSALWCVHNWRETVTKTRIKSAKNLHFAGLVKFSISLFRSRPDLDCSRLFFWVDRFPSPAGALCSVLVLFLVEYSLFPFNVQLFDCAFGFLDFLGLSVSLHGRGSLYHWPVFRFRICVWALIFSGQFLNLGLCSPGPDRFLFQLFDFLRGILKRLHTFSSISSRSLASFSRVLQRSIRRRPRVAPWQRPRHRARRLLHDELVLSRVFSSFIRLSYSRSETAFRCWLVAQLPRWLFHSLDFVFQPNVLGMWVDFAA